MTRKLQHLLSRATLLLLLFFVSGVTYAQIAATVKCEIRGDGSANLNGLNNDFTNFDFPIVSGETYTFEQLYGIPGNNTAITIGSIQGTLVDILVDGEHNEYSWSRFQSSGGYSASLLLTAENNYYAELTLVFEGGEEPEVTATQTYTVNVVGSGTVDYSYTSESGEVKTGTFVPGEATALDNMSMGAAYIIDITPKPDEGYKFAGMTMNGEEVADALQQYEELGMVTLETSAAEVNLEVTFKEDVPEYNVTYTVTVEGEGTVDYSYYIDGSDTWEKATGTFDLGVATGLNPKKIGPNYGVDIYPKPAEGYKFVKATVNGEEKTDALSKYDSFKFFPVNSDAKEIALHLVFEKEVAEAPYTYTLTVEGEGTVRYDYWNPETNSMVEGAFEPGVALPVYSDQYGISVYPEPAEGYVFKAAYLNDVELTEAPGQYETFNYFAAIPTAAENNLKVVFEKAGGVVEDYDMIVNYEVEGEGEVDYFYFVKGTTEAEGTLSVGQNIFPEMYKSPSFGYSVTFTSRPAEGSILKALYINGTEVNVNSKNQYKYTTKVDQETVNVKAVFGAPVATLTFEAEAEGGKVAVTDAEGNVLESGNEYPIGTVVNIAVTPAENFALKALTVNGTEVAAGEPVDGTYNVSYTLVEGDNNIVAEFEALITDYDVMINLTVEGEGVVTYEYDKAEPIGEIVTGELVVGENKLPNIYKSTFGGYNIYVFAEPAKGYEVSAVYENGVEQNLTAEGCYLVSTEEKEGVIEVKVVFVPAPEKADMIVNYSQEGNGRLSYYYYTDDADASGYMNDGANEFWDMYCDSYGNYKMYLTAVPEDGSVLKSLTVDGVDKTAEYNESGTLMLTSTGGQTYDVKAVFEEEAQEPTGHKVVIKANGDVEYYIKFSNTEAQRQEFYYVLDKDTTVYLPDNAFCAWNYTYNSNFTVKGLVINGEPLLEPSFYVNSDLEISLDYVVKDYFELEYDEPENGEVIVEYQVWDMDVKDYVYVPYEAGMPLETGTGYRVTYVADENSYIASIKVNGEVVMTSTVEEPVYEYTYEGKVWGQTVFEAEILSEISVDEVAAEPVQMTVYSVDGVLVRSCLAKDAKEAVEGLEKGLYIVNGQKILVK